jgi:hypothetical protein
MSKRLNGGLTHGILKMLALCSINGARTSEITNVFPSLEGNSTLTYMRRKDLIAKAGQKQTAPWIITVAGAALLNELEPYTPAVYWGSVWGAGKDGWNSERSLKVELGNVDFNLYPWDQPVYMNKRHYGNYLCN